MPKKSKNTKKTDLKSQKPWLKKAKVSEYKIETQETLRTLLIVCEGQTEELYFKSFPVRTLKVSALGLGKSKLELVETAQKIQSHENYDEVWCVFDLDIKLDVKNCIPDFDNAIDKAKDLGFGTAYSNDCFELWFYLHYYFTDQKHHRTFYYEQLSKLWGVSYEREGKKWKFCNENYKRLESDVSASQEEAIKRAEKLFIAQKELSYHKQNPVTLIYQLVRTLNAASL